MLALRGMRACLYVDGISIKYKRRYGTLLYLKILLYSSLIILLDHRILSVCNIFCLLHVWTHICESKLHIRRIISTSHNFTLFQVKLTSLVFEIWGIETDIIFIYLNLNTARNKNLRAVLLFQLSLYQQTYIYFRI